MMLLSKLRYDLLNIIDLTKRDILLWEREISPESISFNVVKTDHPDAYCAAEEANDSFSENYIIVTKNYNNIQLRIYQIKLWSVFEYERDLCRWETSIEMKNNVVLDIMGPQGIVDRISQDQINPRFPEESYVKPEISRLLNELMELVLNKNPALSSAMDSFVKGVQES